MRGLGTKGRNEMKWLEDRAEWNWRLYMEGAIQEWWDLTRAHYEKIAQDKKGRGMARTELGIGMVRGAQLKRWIGSLEHPAEAFVECPMLEEICPAITASGAFRWREWLEQRPWKVEGEKPAPGWLKKWLPMVVMLKKESVYRVDSQMVNGEWWHFAPGGPFTKVGG